MADLEILPATIAAGQTVSAAVGTGFKVIVVFAAGAVAQTSCRRFHPELVAVDRARLCAR